MKKFLLSLGVLLSLVMFVGCDNDDEDYRLYNTWILVSYINESDEVQKEANGYYYQITFHPDGTYSGKAYGNDMWGEYKINGKEISINYLFITQLYVEGSDPDKFFLKHLEKIYTYTITDMELRLYYSEDQYFKFRIKNDQK